VEQEGFARGPIADTSSVRPMAFFSRLASLEG